MKKKKNKVRKPQQRAVVKEPFNNPEANALYRELMKHSNYPRYQERLLQIYEYCYSKEKTS